MKLLVLIMTSFMLFTSPAHANCDTADKSCIMQEIYDTSASIENSAWRDKILRELAKSYTAEGKENEALPIIAQIEKPDTKAMTIRGIGMAAADSSWNDIPRYTTLFQNLTKQANAITHPPSQAIAYTYIAMAQAFAGDDKGAFTTAKAMQNDALRNKAFGETAEIQAEQGKLNLALQSIEQISSLAFRNKAYGLIAKIFTKKGMLSEAYTASHKITNSYAKSQALQDIVNFGNKEETLPDKQGTTQ